LATVNFYFLAKFTNSGCSAAGTPSARCLGSFCVFTAGWRSHAVVLYVHHRAGRFLGGGPVGRLVVLVLTMLIWGAFQMAGKNVKEA
jgi:hypothetical protein